MRTFISWSGEHSRRAGLGLKSLLEDLFTDGVEVFMSEDIRPGEPWAGRLNDEIEHSDFGILCLTEDNFEAPWLLFEAGAIAKQLGSKRVVPYLIDPLPPAADRSPLFHFQHVTATEDGTRRLIKSINEVRTPPLSDQRLEKSYGRWWGDFAQTIKMLASQSTSGTVMQSDRELLEAILNKVEVLCTKQSPSLTPGEMVHLVNLKQQQSIVYKRVAPLQKELRRLRDLGLIKNKRGPIGELPEAFQLDQYFELSDSGLYQVLRSLFRD
jgi:hypothetical protein